MTDLQKEFLPLCIVEQMSYNMRAQKPDFPNSILSRWHDELKGERLKIPEIRTHWARKKIKKNIYYFLPMILIPRKKMFLL